MGGVSSTRDTPARHILGARGHAVGKLFKRGDTSTCDARPLGTVDGRALPLIQNSPGPSCLSTNFGYAHTEVGATATNTLLGGALETTLELELGNTLADGLAVGGTLGGRLFAVTAADTDTVDHVALLSLVAEAARLVGARGTRRAVDDRELTVLPAADTRDELENVLNISAGVVPERIAGGVRTDCFFV